MKRFKRNHYLLESFGKFNKQQQKHIQRYLDTQQCQYLIEVLANIGLGNVKIDDKCKKQFNRHQQKINKLLSKKLAFSKKKKLLVNGSFFPALLGILASSAVPALIDKLLNADNKASK